MTLADVAAAVGLSPAAVSLALRGEPGVADDTRRRVVETARRLGYRRVVGGTRKRQRPMTIGLVIKAPQGDAPDVNRFYALVMAGIEESCRLHRLDLMLATMPVDDHGYPLEVPRIAIDRTCDALIVVGVHLSGEVSDMLVDTAPIVLVDAYADDARFDSVATDNLAGARVAVEHLVAKGHREIAILGTEANAFPSMLQRRSGYEQVIAERGLKPHFVDAPYFPAESAATVGAEFLRAHPAVTGVFCANDAIAVALLQRARAVGMEVPAQVSVVGFDDIDLAAFVTPPLTTMAVDKVGMGRLAVTLLANRLELGRESVTQTLLRPQLIERESVRQVIPGRASGRGDR